MTIACSLLGLYGGWRIILKFKVDSFVYDLSCAEQRFRAEVQARSFKSSCRSGSDNCQQLESK